MVYSISINQLLVPLSTITPRLREYKVINLDNTSEFVHVPFDDFDGVEVVLEQL